MNTTLLRGLQILATLDGSIRHWYLRNIFLPLVQSGGDTNRINVRLVQADFRETRLILEAMGALLDPSAYIETHLILHNGRPDYHNLQVGADCYIGKDCFLDLTEPVILQDRVTLAMRVTVVTHFNVGKSTVGKFYPRSSAPVMIKRGAYIAAGAFILPGVTIHEGALVAARAVVREDVLAGTVVAGNPSRLIKRLESERQDAPLK